MALVELFDAVLPGFSERLAARMVPGPSAFLADPASFGFGAYVETVPAGVACGCAARYPYGRLVTYLHEVDVREEFRRRRIATSLIESSMQVAPGGGVGRVRAWTT